MAGGPPYCTATAGAGVPGYVLVAVRRGVPGEGTPRHMTRPPGLVMYQVSYDPDFGLWPQSWSYLVILRQKPHFSLWHYI